MAHLGVITQDLRLGGGVTTKLVALLKWAASRGHRCDVLYLKEAPSPAGLAEPLLATGAVDRLVAVPVPEALPHFARAEWFARRCPSLAAYDALQVVGPWLSYGVPMVLARRPYVAWIGGSFRDEVEGMGRSRLRHFVFYNTATLSLMAAQERRGARAAVVILADSRAAADRLRGDLDLPGSRLEVLPCPIDLQTFHPGQPATDRPYALCVTRLFRGKGLPVLLRAFKQVAERRPDFDLIVAGEGRERADSEGLARELGIAGRVRFTGQRAGGELIDLYRRATLFVLASQRESLSIVTLEAMACGLPVVCTDSGGPADHVVQGETGWLVPVGDAEALASRMIAVAGDPPRARQMGEAGRRRAEATVSPERIGDRLDEIHADVFGIAPVAGRVSS